MSLNNYKILWVVMEAVQQWAPLQPTYRLTAKPRRYVMEEKRKQLEEDAISQQSSNSYIAVSAESTRRRNSDGIAGSFPPLEKTTHTDTLIKVNDTLNVLKPDTILMIAVDSSNLAIEDSIPPIPSSSNPMVSSTPTDFKTITTVLPKLQVKAWKGSKGTGSVGM